MECSCVFLGVARFPSVHETVFKTGCASCGTGKKYGKTIRRILGFLGLLLYVQDSSVFVPKWLINAPRHIPIRFG